MASPDQSAREKAIFEEAFEIASAEERLQFVREACGGDDRLLDRVLALLRADEHGAHFLPDEAPAPAVAAQGAVGERPGDTIGSYKLIEQIGEGGCGVVYLAEQQVPVRRRVALQIIKLGMDTRQVVARFEAERQALALMDHPNIAKVLDGGVVGAGPGGTEGRSQASMGRPYFVMELVQGPRITAFCSQQSLSVAQRLGLFVQVCRAVQHAHQKGVIHRDLKPSNILVSDHDGVPTPKVIDFGIAKAIGQRLTEKTVFTQFHAFIGTPAYMSPEQAEMGSADIDTRSDIYSMGVLLYELLTSATPFPEERLAKASYTELQRIILHEEPERPSARLMSRKPGRIGYREALLDRDLDWIVLKCLEKDRNRRYETANGLAADILRHLSNEPVAARPPSTLYRMQKAVRRNKLPVAVASLAAIALILAAGVSSWLALEAKRSEREARAQAVLAREQAEIARAVKEFLTNQLLRGANPFVDPVSDPNRLPLLERVARQLEGKFPKQPEIEAQIRFALADAFAENSAPAQCAAQLEMCLAIRRGVLPRQHSDTLETMARLANIYTGLGRHLEAQQLVTEAMAVARIPGNGNSRGAGWVIFEQGDLLFRSNRNREALPFLQEGIAVYSRNADVNDFDRFGMRLELAYATYYAGQPNEAETICAAALRDCEQVHGGKYPMTAMLQKCQADLFIMQGQWQKGLAILEKSVAIHRRVLGPNHINTLEAESLLAGTYEQKGDLDEAVKIDLDLHPRLARWYPGESARRHGRGIGQFFVRQRRFGDARAVFASLAASFESSPPQLEWEFDIWLESVAATQGWGAAADLCERHLQAFPDVIRVWQSKAWALRYAGREVVCGEVANKVLALLSNERKWDDDDLTRAVQTLALSPDPFSTAEMSQINGLIALFETALAHRASKDQAEGRRALAHLQLQLGRLPECRASLEQVELNHTEPDAAALFIKPACLQRLNDIAAAHAAFAAADAILDGQLPRPLSENEDLLGANQLHRLLVLRCEAEKALETAADKK